MNEEYSRFDGEPIRDFVPLFVDGTPPTGYLGSSERRTIDYMIDALARRFTDQIPSR